MHSLDLTEAAHLISVKQITAETFWGLTSSAWGAIGALASVATVLIALAAAIVALRQLRQGRGLAEEQARPYVVVSPERSEADANHLDLVLRNVGHTAARDVRIAIDPPYERVQPNFGGERFMDARIFHSAIPTMPPGFSIRMYLDDVGAHSKANDHPSVYNINLEYKDRKSQLVRDTFVLDLDSYEGILTLQVHGLHHIASSLRAMAKEQGINSF